MHARYSISIALSTKQLVGDVFIYYRFSVVSWRMGFVRGHGRTSSRHYYRWATREVK